MGVAEIVQMGLVQVYVYSDVPWVPYERLFRRFGFVVEFENVPELLARLRNTSLKRVERMERLHLGFYEVPESRN